jgi:hypothetical protein
MKFLIIVSAVFLLVCAVLASDPVPVTEPAVRGPDRPGKRPSHVVYQAPTFPGITTLPVLAEPVYISSITAQAVVE